METIKTKNLKLIFTCVFEDYRSAGRWKKNLLVTFNMLYGII